MKKDATYYREYRAHRDNLLHKKLDEMLELLREMSGRSFVKAVVFQEEKCKFCDKKAERHGWDNGAIIKVCMDHYGQYCGKPLTFPKDTWPTTPSAAQPHSSTQTQTDACGTA